VFEKSCDWLLANWGSREVLVVSGHLNHESFSLAKKIGFREEGLHRRAFRCGLGELDDVHYLSFIAEDCRSGTV
jgi:RimJ/RimL family protein N-acetyltransferase